MHLAFHWLANRMITTWACSCFGDSLLSLLLICHCTGWVQTESAVRRVALVLSHQKHNYSRSRSFGVTLADEFEDAPFTACLITTLPTPDLGTHYSTFWSFGITQAEETQISPKRSSANAGIPLGHSSLYNTRRRSGGECVGSRPAPSWPGSCSRGSNQCQCTQVLMRLQMQVPVPTPVSMTVPCE